MIEQVNEITCPGTIGVLEGYTGGQYKEGENPEGHTVLSRFIAADPINQLNAILNSHLRTLNKIDGDANRLEDQVEELEKDLGFDNRARR